MRHRRNGSVRLWVTLHLQSLCVLLLLSYLMGTPDCLMCTTAVPRTPHPAVLIWSNRGPTAGLSRRSASCRLPEKRSIQVISQLAGQVTHDYLYHLKQTRLLHPHTPPTFLSVPVSDPRLEAGQQPVWLLQCWSFSLVGRSSSLLQHISRRTNIVQKKCIRGVRSNIICICIRMPEYNFYAFKDS